MKPILMLLAFLVSAGCPRTAPGVPGEINCHTDVLRSGAARLLPAVNRCLMAVFDSDWRACLLGLIQPAAGVGEDALACALREPASEAATAGAKASSPPDVRRQVRAREFIQDRGYRFTPGGSL